MEAKSRASILRDMIPRMGAGGADITTEEWLEFVEAQNHGYQTGPAIGARVPDFILPDQNGRMLALKDLMGPNGLALIFSRSADW